MKIAAKFTQDICIMSISGRIDSNSSGELENALHDAMNEKARIIMDLADTEYISSSGLRVLLSGKKMLNQKNGRMVLVSLQPVVRDVFEIAGLAKVFSIEKSWEEALTLMKCEQ